jgi:hypothetical protein
MELKSGRWTPGVTYTASTILALDDIIELNENSLVNAMNGDSQLRGVGEFW